MRKAALLCVTATFVAACVAGLYATVRPTTVLGGFTTSFEGRLNDQSHNARLAAARLDGAVIAPGAVFSFNERVGSWSRDQGYRKAPVSFSGTLVNEWGGGVCQTSTTLYNAGLLAGLDPIERHPHQFAANYVPAGRDAAVAYPSVDLRFRNPYPFPVAVRAKTSPAGMTIQIVGAGKPSQVTVTGKLKDIERPDQFQIGHGRVSRVRNPGKPGFVVETVRFIDGRRESLGTDSYPAMTRVLERKG